MSFLGSLLSDISGGKPHQSSGKPLQIIPRPRSAGPSSDRPTTPASNGQEASKRKNDEPEASSTSNKWPRLGSGSIPSARPGSASALSADKASRSQGVASLKATPLKSSPKPVSKAPQARAAPPPASAVKAVAAAPPKKGSFRDLMERGKRAHEAQKDKGLGQIKHKEVPKHTRRERLKLALEEKQKAKAQGQSGSRAGAPSSRPVSSQAQNGKKTMPLALAPKKQERQPLEYKGTMRSQPLNKPRNAVAPGRPAQARPAQARRPNLDEYESDDGEDDDDGYERRYRYAGSSADEDENESDDMAGGGFDELEAEEEASLRAARKEDAEAQRQEEVHRTEKMARKHKLDELRQARAAKGR